MVISHDLKKLPSILHEQMSQLLKMLLDAQINTPH